MGAHRIRLSDSDLTIICAALRARMAMTRGARRLTISRLVDRLEECSPGNPNLRLYGELLGDDPRYEASELA